MIVLIFVCIYHSTSVTEKHKQSQNLYLDSRSDNKVAPVSK